MTLAKTEAIARWNKHLKKSKKNSEGQLERHHEKHLIAAEKLREGMGPVDINRETGVGMSAIYTAQKLVAKGEI